MTTVRTEDRDGGVRLLTLDRPPANAIAPELMDDMVTALKAARDDDAVRAGLQEGELADVSTETATVRVPVKVLSELMPGTVALPHGWGHQDSKMGVASQTTGVNVNLLAADGPDKLEKVSGMAHLTGFLVDVKPAGGALDPTHWSGIGR